MKYISNIRSENHYFIIDLRKKELFELGHIPKSINLPFPRRNLDIFLKQLRQQILDAFEAGYSSSPKKIAKPIVLICANGGYASKWVWDKLRLQYDTYIYKGGYAAFRKCVKRCFETPIKFMLLCGNTGTGKTKMLHAIEQVCSNTICFATLANHTGSVFGNLANNPEPTQQLFENEIYIALAACDLNQPVLTEYEMPNIGPVYIPRKLYAQMENGIPIYIGMPIEKRVEQLVADYAHVNDENLSRGINQMEPKLGVATCRLLQEKLKQKKYDFIAETLIAYFDETDGYSKMPFKESGVAIKPQTIDEALVMIQEILAQKKRPPKKTLLRN